MAWHVGRPGSDGTEGAVALVQKDRWRVLPSRDDDVDRAIVVQIGSDGADRRCIAAEGRLVRPIHESAVSLISPKNVPRRRSVGRECKRSCRMAGREAVEPRDVKIEIP